MTKLKILALECSGAAASSALLIDGVLVAEAFTNAKITHSQTLLKMTSDMLNSAKVEIKDIDGFAISAGPGSFTGVRIGISAVKGLAQPFNKPCVAVSSLSAIAENFKSQNCLVCAVLDARCNQVYDALFKIKDGYIDRIKNEKVKEYVRENQDDLVYKFGTDVQVYIDGKLVLPIECKAYTENAMMKRILFDASLMKETKGINKYYLVQLESQLGGDYSQLNEITYGSPATHALLSHVDVDLEINVPSEITCEIQEMHMALAHVACELVEE